MQIAAFIAEPVMGAGGVIPPPSTYFEKVRVIDCFPNYSHNFHATKFHLHVLIGSSCA